MLLNNLLNEKLMIITLEHEDIEAALIAWMNEKGMVAPIETTTITTNKARNTGRLTAIINPTGNQVKTVDIPKEEIPPPVNKIFNANS